MNMSLKEGNSVPNSSALKPNDKFHESDPIGLAVKPNRKDTSNGICDSLTAMGSFDIGITYEDHRCKFLMVDEATEKEAKEFSRQ